MAKRGRKKGSFRPHPAGEREQAMYLLMKEGKSFSDIGVTYGITRERVRQLFLKYYGITAKEYARNKISAFRKASTAISHSNTIKNNLEIRRLRMFGCSDEVVTSIHGRKFTQRSGDKYGPAWSYKEQQRNAKVRGIKWNMTLPEWWEIWERSGKYNLRGRCKGEYVMARYGDSGSYQVDNVYITEASNNIKDIYKNKTDEELIWMRLRHRKSHCKRGHELFGDNLYVSPKGQRGCKACHRIIAGKNRYRSMDMYFPEISMATA